MHHSRLIVFHECGRELEFNNFNATVSILNCESNLQMIQAQTLSFKLWFVPVVTSAVVALFNGQAAVNKSNPLNGYSVVATASVPLYNLYTPQTSSFEAKVAWKICGTDRSVGYIATVFQRLDGTGASNSQLYEMHCEGYQAQVQMSTIKPLNLSRSYSPQTTKKRSVDPPCSSSSKKRKLEGHDPCEEELRQSLTVLESLERNNTEHFACSQQNLKRPRPSMSQACSKSREAAALMSDGMANPVQQDTSNYCSQDIHIKEDRIRSQSSQHPREMHRSTPDATVTSTVDKALPFIPEKSHASNAEPEAKYPTYNSTTPTQLPSQPQQPLVKTCEKGSSPILITLRYADASTSPCGEPPTSEREKASNKPKSEVDVNNSGEYIDNSNDTDTREDSKDSSLHRRLDRFTEEKRGSAMPHRLKSKVMQNYFSGQSMIISGTLGGCRSANGAILSPTARNFMNLRSPIASKNKRVRSPLQPLRSPLRTNNVCNDVPSNKIGHSKSTAGSPTGLKPSISNRERIERIFSGKK
jgi:hypothetical protein